MCKCMQMPIIGCLHLCTSLLQLPLAASAGGRAEWASSVEIVWVIGDDAFPHVRDKLLSRLAPAINTSFLVVMRVILLLRSWFMVKRTIDPAQGFVSSEPVGPVSRIRATVHELNPSGKQSPFAGRTCPRTMP